MTCQYFNITVLKSTNIIISYRSSSKQNVANKQIFEMTRQWSGVTPRCRIICSVLGNFLYSIAKKCPNFFLNKCIKLNIKFKNSPPDEWSVIVIRKSIKLKSLPKSSQNLFVACKPFFLIFVLALQQSPQTFFKGN